MQQDNTWQDKGPGKETSKPRQYSSKTDKTTDQDKKKRHTQKAVDFAQKAAKRPLFRQLTDLFSTCLHTLFTQVVILTHV